MSPVDIPHIHISDEHGFTLIELLVAMVIGMIVSLGAFSLLEFTTSDVSRVTARAHVDQTGRAALEKLMLQLHSACVAVTINPIMPKSTETAIKFISETSPLNSKSEPISSLSTVHLHEVSYNKAAGTLTEKSWLSTGTTPAYSFTEAEAKNEFTEHRLLTGVTQSVNATTKKEIPIFRYYRYYTSNDTKIKLGEAKLGELDPTELSNVEMAKEEVKEKVKVTEAEKVAKVTVTFTLLPEGKEGILAKGDQPVALEDSAVLRFTPSSEEAGNTNEPCAEI